MDIFRKNGNLMEVVLIESNFERALLNTLDMLRIPRLDWSDRYLDIIQQCQKNLPNKLIMTGRCLYSKKNLPYIMLYSRSKKRVDCLKTIGMEGHEITTLTYGPYDNGHIILGLTNGMVQVFNASTLARMYALQLFTDPIAAITFEPTKLVLVANKAGLVMGFSMLTTNTQYIYLDLGQKKYCTLAISKEAKKKMRSMSPNRASAQN